MAGQKMLFQAAVLLLVVGGLNWGLTVLNYNVVDMLLTAGSTATKVVYGLVALSGLYVLLNWKKVSM